jgi:hypothetical protein
MQFPGLRPVLVLAALMATASQAAAAPIPVVGSYTLVQDDDGTTPRADAQITLVLLPDGSAILTATLPGTPTITDKGNWSLNGEKLSLVLPDSGKVLYQTKFSLEGRDLTLPFRLFSDAEGKSLWRRSASLSLRPFAKDKDPAPTKTVIVPPTTAPEPEKPLAIYIPPTPAPESGELKTPSGLAPTPEGPKAPAKTPPQVSAAPEPPAAAPAAPAAAAYVGRYEGTAIGAEVRYRKDGVFTLMAKHTATFWFEINEKNEVKGAGQITYALDADRKGSGEDTGEIENFPTSYAPGASLIQHDAALAGGQVIKDFEIKGTYDPKTNSLSLAPTSELGDLVYEYESAGKRATRPFPAWSPFLNDAPGTLEIAPGGEVKAGLDLSGKGRRDKWQEYRFVWSAKKTK